MYPSGRIMLGQNAHVKRCEIFVWMRIAVKPLRSGQLPHATVSGVCTIIAFKSSGEQGQ